LRQHPDLTLKQRVGLISQVGRALDHCHKKEVIHGGLCPSSVLVRKTEDGG
jgi:tRNA A-37 threonylcarbamoyl transferase component Bud32